MKLNGITSTLEIEKVLLAIDNNLHCSNVTKSDWLIIGDRAVIDKYYLLKCTIYQCNFYTIYALVNSELSSQFAMLFVWMKVHDILTSNNL